MTPRLSRTHLRAAAAFAVAAGAAVLIWAALRPGEAPTPQRAPVPAIASVTVRAAAAPGPAPYEGVVQAVRQTVLAAQVSGAVVALDVKAGDTVRAGQLLLRLDARAAEQGAAAGAAQVRAAGAALEAAERDVQRQQQLFAQKCISQSALERAEAQFKTARAEASAQLASAGAARTQTDFYVIRAPYAGVVSDVSVVLGDMAMPGRPLVTLHDPAALRVSAAVPQGVAEALAKDALPPVELSSGRTPRLSPVRMQVLPAVDPATHTQELRLDLPPGSQAAPGMFARVWLPAVSTDASRIFVPAAAVLRRSELTAVYVIDDRGRPLLRPVRLGRADGGQVELLSGVSVGERVALDAGAVPVAR
jgi:membrane fusion protein, multidrug efflux system